MLIREDPDAGKDWGQEKGVTEDEMAGWHHWLNGHEFEQTVENSGTVGSTRLPYLSPKELYVGEEVTVRTFSQFSLVAQLCPTLCNSMDCSMPGFPVLRCLSEFPQTSVFWVDDTIQSDAWYHF